MPKLASTVTTDVIHCAVEAVADDSPASSTALTRADCELSVARDYGFDTWAELEVEVHRRELLAACDLDGLEALLRQRPDLATAPMRRWCDHGDGTRPLTYVALMRYDTATGVWADRPGSGAIATALIAAGALVHGDDGDAETPLMTAASYGDAEVAAALLQAGADPSLVIEGNDGGPALRQAATCGMTAVVDVLLAAGATDIVQAAGAGDLAGLLSADTPTADKVAALRFAAAHGQLHVIDELIASGTPVDGLDHDGSSALHEAAGAGRADSVRHLLSLGADPARRDTRFSATPLEWAEHQDDPANPARDLAGIRQMLGSAGASD